MDLPQIGSVQLNIESSTIDNTYYSHITINPPAQPEKRRPACVICVLDISGSMDNEATQGQAVESDGFSRLDLVKHSVNTIVHSLETDDFLGVVTFSNHARVDLSITQMNENGKKSALQMVEKMKTEGATNLWDGIRLGLEQTKDQKCKGKNTYVVVLSDGEPNQHPPKGELATVKQYIENNPLSCSMSMFGYGYNLDTKLLSGLTSLGGGCYGYIPDCSMVGTIFVNFLSTVLSTFSTSMSIQVTNSSGKLKLLNGKDLKKVKMGPVQYGSKRNVLVSFEDVKQNEQFGNLIVYYGQNERKTTSIALKHNGNSNSPFLKTQMCRFKYINFLNQTSQNFNLKQANESADELIQEMENYYQQSKDQYLGRLIRDLKSEQKQEGQVKIALSQQQYWKKWGVHYYPALKIAHQIEMCTNFKDPGIQLYAGQVFKNNQNRIDTIFIKLPPPEPTIKKYDSDGNLKQVSDMSAYYDEYGGCIGCDSQIKMADGTIKKANQLQKDDEVLTLTNQKAKVKCIIETKLYEEVQLVEFDDGLLITKYHPVMYKGKWQFPIDIKPIKKVKIDSYFNFVLENGHCIVANGVQCATLGHGFMGSVIEHDYLGTEKVIKDLQKVQGYEMGKVNLRRDAWRRNPQTKRINGIKI